MYYLYDPKERLHTFFTQSLAYELKEFNKEVMILHKAYPEEIIMNVKDEDIFIYIVHPIYLFKDEEVLKTVSLLKTKKTKKILYITEPLTLMMDRKNYRILITQMNIFESWTYTIMNQMFLSGHRIRRISPLFSNTYEWVSFEEKKKNLEKIIFIGNPTKNRMEILEKFGDMVFIIKEGMWEIEDWRRILIQYIFYINIHRIPRCPCMETMRLTPILSTGGFVVSENVNEKEMKEYEDYNIIFGKREDLLHIFEKVIQNWDWNEYFNRWKRYREKMLLKNELKEISWLNYKCNN